ncbi:hypothetical protein [Fontibacillus sp. BL9]|uniref:hypothetical protein n=1 Tax=Fontibacillus sp. BL9 TaxID=3389971 RepID=UPI0039796C16
MGKVKSSNIITTEERTMIRDYVLLNHMQVMAEKSIRDLKYSDNLLRQAFIMCGKIIEERILQESKSLRLDLKDRGIVINKEEHADFVVYYHYTCRGYSERFGLTRDVMRAEIGIKFGKYISEVGQILKASK